jgi:hypothetical protein
VAGNDLPIIRIGRNRIRARQISQIICVPGGVTRNRNILSLTGGLIIIRDGQSNKGLWRFNYRCRETHDNMPLNMTMEQPNPRIISHKPNNSITVRINSDRIPFHRNSGEVSNMPIECPFPRGRFLANLELMAVEMERVDGCIEIIDRELHDRAFLGDVGIHPSVDGWVGVLSSGANGCEERGNLLCDVIYVVEACPVSRLVTGLKFEGEMACLPWDPAGIEAESEVQRDVDIWCSQERLVVQRHKSEIVHNAPFVHDVRRGERFRAIVNDISRDVQGVCGSWIIQVISILI